MALSKTQMRMYATAAGFSHPDLIAEIGFAESGGDTNARNSIGATGWLQVLQPLHVKDHPTWTVAYLKNPLNNARAAKVLWNADVRAGGDGTRPWADSKSKGNGGGWGKSAAYASFKGGKPDTDQAVWNPTTDLFPDSVEGVPTDELIEGTPLEAVADIAHAVEEAAKWISNPRSWLNVGYVLVGGVVIVVALSATVRGQVIGQAGKLIKAVKK